VDKRKGIIVPKVTNVRFRKTLVVYVAFSLNGIGCYFPGTKRLQREGDG
jgi:hypothetical protein